jgi:hypothetical protein
MSSKQQTEIWFRRGSVAAGIVATFVAIAPSAHAQKDMSSCKVVFDAATKMTTTPNHAYVIMNLGAGAPKTTEAITTPTGRFIQVNGKWMRNPMSAQDELARTKQNIQNATAYSCHKVRSETVTGVATTLYSAHEVTEAGASDSQVWIANGTGLLVREELHLSGGGTVSTRIDYANVKAPAGVP